MRHNSCVLQYMMTVRHNWFVRHDLFFIKKDEMIYEAITPLPIQKGLTDTKYFLRHRLLWCGVRGISICIFIHICTYTCMSHSWSFQRHRLLKCGVKDISICMFSYIYVYLHVCLFCVYFCGIIVFGAASDVYQYVYLYIHNIFIYKCTYICRFVYVYFLVFLASSSLVRRERYINMCLFIYICI